jgi:hypothetical protein
VTVADRRIDVLLAVRLLMSPAHLRHANRPQGCSLSKVLRKSDFAVAKTVFDPKQSSPVQQQITGDPGWRGVAGWPSPNKKTIILRHAVCIAFF